MKYRNSSIYAEIAEATVLVPFSTEYALNQFDCGVSDYNVFLANDAQYYVDNHISSVHLLLDSETGDIIAYIAFLSDAFRLDEQEKEKVGLDIPFNSVPALKIGKLAVAKNRKERPYGSYLLELSLGFVQDLLDSGIACRFLTVDADVEFDPDTPNFYLENGFVFNEHKEYKKRTKNRSMRYDFLEK